MGQERKILCQNLWKIFGPQAGSVLEALQNGLTKEQVFRDTGHIIAVRDVSFEVRENEVFVIMGLSGSGKSTLLRCINRLIKPTKGTVFVDGTDLAQLTDDELKELRRRKLSMVFQNFGLLPHRSVLDNVAFGLEVRGEGKRERAEKALQALELVGLRGWEKSRIQELSGGMQQRVGLARALAVGSEILLMDEPFSALDPLIRRQMQDEFLNLRSVVKKTVVFITHDLVEALKLGDHIAIMKDGEIVQVGTPEEIVVQPANPYVKEFVKDVPRGKVLSAGAIMERPSVVARDDQELESVIGEMQANEVGTAFVTDGLGRLKGIVSLEQALSASHDGLIRAGELVGQDFPATSPDVPLEQCLPLVAKNELPVAVLDAERRLLGVITKANLLQALQSDEEETESPSC